jgi:hypothetical protein
MVLEDPIEGLGCQDMGQDREDGLGQGESTQDEPGQDLRRDGQALGEGWEQAAEFFRETRDRQDVPRLGDQRIGGRGRLLTGENQHGVSSMLKSVKPL